MKRNFVAAAFAVAGLLAAVPANAQDCSSKPNQMEMDACVADAHQAADSALNAAYRKLKAMLNAQQAQLLTAAEKQWISYRDAECAFETASTEGGALHGAMVSECLTDKTKARLAELNKQIACPAGNLACPAN